MRDQRTTKRRRAGQDRPPRENFAHIPDYARLIRLLGTIAEATVSAATVPDMLRVAVDAICRFLKWPVGHAFVPSRASSQELVSSGIWHLDDPKRFASFRRASRSFLNIERGLIGRAVAAKKAVHASDVSDKTIGFIYLDEAREGGLISGIVLPVMAGESTIAVLEFYTTARSEPDAPLLAALDQIARHVSQVAERIQTREALRRSETVLTRAFEHVLDAIIVIDERGIVQSANRATERIFGFAPDELVGRNVALLMPKDTAAQHDGYLRNYFRTGVAKVIGIGREVVARRKSGETFPADLVISDINSGGRRLFVGALRDLSERKTAERRAQAAERRLADAIEGIGDGIALFDKNERLVRYNRSYADALSVIADVLKPGMTFENVVRALAERNYYGPVDEAWMAERLRRFRELKDIEFAAVAPDGARNWRVLRHCRTSEGGTLLIRADITERRRAETELESVRQLLQTALDSITDGVALFDRDERLVLFNDGYANSSSAMRDFIKPGVTITDIVTHLTARGVYGRADKDWVNRRLRQFRALEPVEFRVCDPGKDERWVNTRHYRTRDGGTFVVRTDITERKRAEAELESARELLQTALDSMTDGVALFDKDERLVLINESYARKIRLPRDILKPGITFTEIVMNLMVGDSYVGADKKWIDERIRRFRALEPVEMRLRDPGGSERWYYVNLYRTRDGGTFLVRTDITAHKLVEAELESAQQLLQTALDSMTGGVALYDKDERLILFNEGYARSMSLIGDILRPGLMLAEEVAALMERGNYVGVGEDWVTERIRAFRALEPIESRQRDVAGKERWFSSRHYRTRAGGTFLVRTDITARMRAIDEIERARVAAETANEAKTKFLASMSHELRTPLNAILGFAQMLEIGAGKIAEEKRREYLAIILKSGQHLLDLVNQILELAMVENQQAEMRIQALLPAQKAEECVDMVREEAKRREVEIVDQSGALGPDVRFLGDPVRVRQVLLNLLSNAVKYNRPGGRVTISCTPNGDGMVRFAVADTGLGIPPERHGEVFQPFQRLGREAGQIEGSGIGLALARQLIQRMGGKIGFKSEPDQGSTFWFELPEAENESEEWA